MKRWIIGLAILILLSSMGCEAQDNNGLFHLGNLSCAQEEAPALDSTDSVLFAADGIYDLEVAKYAGAQAGYYVRPWLGNKRVSSQKDALSRGEGNDIRIKGLEVRYEALGLEIEKLFIPQNFTISPQGVMVPEVNIMPYEIRNQILEYWAKNAYADVDNARTYFHVDANGGTADCTNFSAEDDCNGYSCVTSSVSSLDTDSAGKCMPTCTLESGCAKNCFNMTSGEAGAEVESPFCYPGHVEPKSWCDTGAGDLGYCRPTCFETGYCPPVTLPDGTVALEYDCMDGYCYPKGTQVNPHKGENLIVKIKALAEGSNGDDFTSNTYTFNLRVCRGCLLSFHGTYCGMTGTAISDALSDGGFKCSPMFLGQDIEVDCSLFNNCRTFFCEEIMELESL